MIFRQTRIAKKILSAIRPAVRLFTIGHDGTAGSALVEFTLFAPLLVITSIYTMDYGLYYFNQLEVQNAAQSAVQYAIVTGSAPPSSTDFTGNSITISAPVRGSYCPSSSSPYLTSATQGSTCSDGSIAGIYIGVTGSATYDPLVRFFPFSNSSYILSGAAMVRVQ